MTGPRIAIVGAGPAGAYTVAALRRSGVDAQIDVIDRLPTPWGLLRAGVAPDHQEVRRLETVFARELARSGARFIGNVEVGRDLRHADLAAAYSAIVYATGAGLDRAVGVPGEDLPGHVRGTAFVNWYNAHPDQRDLDPPLSGRRAVIIGNGNVAADVARMLTLPATELAATDTADHALAALRESSIAEVVVCGRRGPGHAAFSCGALAELGRLPGVGIEVAAGHDLGDAPAAFASEQQSSVADHKRAIIDRWVADPVRGTRRIVLRFWSAPVRLIGSERVEGIELARTALVADGSGVRLEHTGETESLSCDLVVTAAGQQGAAIPGVPFDDDRGVVPTAEGRVLDAPGGSPKPGLYAVGWIHRGASGVLGTNKRDADRTVATLLHDTQSGRLPVPSGRPIDSLLLDAGIRSVDLDGWRRIDTLERTRGRAQGRPRTRMCSRDELLEASVL